ncbi:Lactonase, 7-bladed beta-propeller-domain-containing protein [Tricladium varicosporioides]|nr:Lactonase, 7-bladed beta-propeller-domain-containing protein [Hymenoscyphus varicosporioides]
MSFRINPLVLVTGLVELTAAANLFVSHYTGTIYSLTLTGSGSSYTLTQNSTVTVPGQPSWMTYDSENRIIYNSDEGSNGVQISSVSATTNGKMTLTGKAASPSSGVHNALYGNGFLAVAHYGASAISTYKLPLGSGASALQTEKFTMSGKGTIPARQDAPHPHGVHVDPTGKFLISPDLGADVIRIYKIDASSGKLTACTSFTMPPGSGPRHAAFYGSDILYVANELSNTVHALTVTYPSGGCMSFSRFQSLTTLANNKTAPSGTKVGEIHIKDKFLYVSNRRDLSFTPNDSIASFSIGDAGKLTFQQITNSGGTYPRTFAINKAGDMVAIGDQTTANVVIVKRDTETGLIGAQIANMRIGSAGRAENDDGLSAVVWDE